MEIPFPNVQTAQGKGWIVKIAQSKPLSFLMAR